MKDKTYSSTADFLNVSSFASHVWKHERTGIIFRALKDAQPGFLKKNKFLNISDDQLRRLQATGNVPPDLLLSLSKKSQIRKDLPGLMMSLAYFSLEDEYFRKEEREYAPWEALLKLLLLAREVEFAHPWLESEKEGSKFLSSGDREIQLGCERAARLLFAVKDLNALAKSWQQEFFDNIGAHLPLLKDKVENLDDYEKLQESLLKIARERRVFFAALRAFRKTLNALARENELPEVKEGTEDGSLLTFIKLVNQKADEWTDSLKAAAADILPRLFDAVKIRRLLEQAVPSIPPRDFDLMLEELGEIEQGLLAQDDSQLAGNILPALFGESGFDMDAFENAMDMGMAKDYSHKFIRHLFAGHYLIPKEDTEDGARDAAEPEAANAGLCPGDESGEAAESFAEDDSDEELEDAEGLSEDDLPASEEAQAEGETLAAQFSEEKAEIPPEAPVDDEEDGFGFIEENLAVPPQPDEALEKSGPESMTLEQACALAEQEKLAEEPPLQDEEDLDIADPLERKFQQKMRAERETGLPSSPSAKAFARAFPSAAATSGEKKSPEFGGKARLKDDPDLECRLSLRKFIDKILESRKTYASGGAEHGNPEAEGKFFREEDIRKIAQDFLDQAELEAFVYLCNGGCFASPYSAALAELLYLGAQYMPGQEEMASRLLELINISIEESEAYSEGENLLLAAAILRPALMMPHEHMRTIISILSGKLAYYDLASFFNALESFVSMHISLDTSIFTGESEERLRQIRFESLRQETADFLRRMRNSRTTYQPASQLRKKLYAQTGLLGSLLENCLHGERGELAAFLTRYADDKAFEKIMLESDLPRRNRPIEASARQRLLLEIRQAVKILRSWQEYFAHDASPANRDYSLEKFHELFEKAPRDMARLKESAEGRILAEQIRELSECPKKALACKSENPLRVLRLWPLRLPIYDPDTKGVTDPFILSEMIRDKSVYKENDVARSLVFHLAAGNLALCQDFLEAYPAMGKTVPNVSGLLPDSLNHKGISVEKYQLAAGLVWEEMFRELADQVKNDIVACEFRGILHTHQPAKYVSQLEEIIQEVEESGDKAKGVRCLELIREDLARTGDQGIAEIQEKIRDLEEREDLSPECRRRLSLIGERRLKDKMLNLAWNELAEITDHLAKGSPLNDLPPDFAAEDNVAHHFYELLEGGSMAASTDADLHIWNVTAGTLKNRINNGRLGAVLTKAMADFMRWLGFTLDQRQQPEVIHSSPAPNYWRVISLKMEISGPLPQWSNRKTRHIAVFGWNARPENINQLLQANFMDNEDCKTIICFNKLDFEDRKRLMTLCGQRKIAPLIVDENLFNFLSACDITARTEALFRIGLTGAGIIPYVDVGGAVPKEMFFGREDDIRALLDPMGPCIVYGGRQLGKSALLQQIHNNQRSGIKTVLHSMANSESSLLEAIRNECVDAGILHAAVQKKNLSAAIKKWLDENPDWRILVLLDECDRVLDLDRANDFAEISVLRDLMNDTQRRFKFVITGLHSVQRFSQIGNQPFLHFGDPLCIGPLSSSAAFELMTAPMSLLGIEFANTRLVQVALNHCGYQPKLIQIFCMELLKGLSNGRKAPFETIDEEGIQKIYGSHNLKKKIVECFDMTLNLDERYLVIGYVLAINHHVRMDLNHLLQELKYYWPDAFDDQKSSSAETLNSLRSLLHEMEGLGLVTRLDNEYMLRTPNVIDLLGGIDQILIKLDPYKDRPYKPVVSLDDMRIRDFEVLVASQFNLLSEKCNGIHWISGNAALGLDQVASVLKKLVEEENRYKPAKEIRLVKLNGSTEHEVFNLLRKKYDGLEGGMICWLSASEFAFADKFMAMARDWLGKLRAGRKFVKIVCIIDPVTLRDFIAFGFADKFSDSHIQLMPWTNAGLEQYYKESALPGGPGSVQIMASSSGWPKLVQGHFRPESSPFKLSLTDFWNGNAKLVKELVAFIANVMDGRLEKENLDEDASAMLDMLPTGMIKDDADMLAWINTLRSLFILRDSGKLLLLDPIARDAILEAQAL